MTDHLGGCLCGAIRYRLSALPFAAEYCHCRMCQRSAGAAFGNWMDLKQDQVTWTSGTPLEYASSANVRRGFCANCGSTLSFRDERHPEYLTLATTSLDEPNAVPPKRHIYTESQLAWLQIDDDCERYNTQPQRD